MDRPSGYHAGALDADRGVSGYIRTAAQRHADLTASKAWEKEVERALPAGVIARTDSTTDLDFYIPGLHIEAKEKRQKLTKRWWLVPNCAEEDLFVLDELSVRKALLHAPYSFFVLRDVPGGRIFYASAIEVAMADRVRRNRMGKGKWILRVTQFRELPSLDQLYDRICAEVRDMRWKDSACWSLEEVEQV